MRLNSRSNVVLPQPDGPMKAVMTWRSIAMVTYLSAALSPYQKDTFSTSMIVSSRRIFGVTGAFFVVMRLYLLYACSDRTRTGNAYGAASE